MAKEEDNKSAAAETTDPQAQKEKGERREIKGGIPYVIAPGILKKALDAIITAERPDKFSGNYMETILKLSGGAARAVPPLLKKMQFIAADGAPTTLYSKFKTDGGRSQAAYDGIRNAFGELFKRNEYINKADENSVKDVIVEITGLKKSDNIVRLMYSSFDTVRSFISGDVSANENQKTENEDEQNDDSLTKNRKAQHPEIALSYQINVVLPETENILVFNAIFKSLRENLLR